MKKSYLFFNLCALACIGSTLQGGLFSKHKNVEYKKVPAGPGDFKQSHKSAQKKGKLNCPLCGSFTTDDAIAHAKISTNQQELRQIASPNAQQPPARVAKPANSNSELSQSPSTTPQEPKKLTPPAVTTPEKKEPIVTPEPTPQPAKTTQDKGVKAEDIKKQEAVVTPEPASQAAKTTDDKKGWELVEIGSEKEFNDMCKSSGCNVVEVYASWCGPCKSMVPRLKRLSQKYSGKIKFAKVNGESFSGIRKKFDIDSYPRFYFYKNGKMVHQTRGGMEESIMEHHLSTAFPELKNV